MIAHFKVPGTDPTRMDHLNTMLQSNFDDLVTGQVGTDRGILTPFTNDVGFVGLCMQVSIVTILLHFS